MVRANFIKSELLMLRLVIWMRQVNWVRDPAGIDYDIHWVSSLCVV